jgi:peptide/nickel transport system permease protein
MKNKNAERKKKSQTRLVLERFAKNKAAVAGTVIMVIMLLIIVGASLFCDYQNAIVQDVSLRYTKPSVSSGINGLMGYDNMGRSMFWRMIFGGRVTLLASIAIVVISMVIGGITGAICGFVGGKVDTIIMRFMDLLLCIPYLMMAMTFVAALGTSIVNLVIALSLASIPMVVRVVRASVLTVRDQDYIEAAYVCGASKIRVIFTHVLNNAMGPIIVYATMLLANQVLSISAMSFLGLGAQPPTPEWGQMISAAGEALRVYPFLTIVPGVVIILSVLSINLIGDGIQAAIDPKLK